MFDDGERFLRRANIFKLELQNEKYPNAARLAKLARCSANTAQRTIDRLRRDYGLPISYDKSRKGYFLTGPECEVPKLPPQQNGADNSSSRQGPDSDYRLGRPPRAAG